MEEQHSLFGPWFASVAGVELPHPWQRELSEEAVCRNRLIRIPTGMGKTLGVLGTWLFYRVVNQNDQWPRRLIWCLPMRTLVEQTAAEAQKIVDKAGLADQVKVHRLLGGVDEALWYGDPEKVAILIGTQDLLLSRALNRGYAMGRAAWPRAFGLINLDALWVMDEVQLMGVGLSTGAQIQAFWDQHLQNHDSPAFRVQTNAASLKLESLEDFRRNRSTFRVQTNAASCNTGELF